MIVVKISDGLGNQMFQYAYARSLHEKTNRKIYLDVSDINNIQSDKIQIVEAMKLCDRREYQLNNFAISLPIINTDKLGKIHISINTKNSFLNYCKELRLLTTVYLTESECREEGFKYSRIQDYYVTGYFFDKYLYEGIEDILHQEFKLKNGLHLPWKIRKIIRDRNTVSLHIRRQDFLKVGRDLSEDDYYNRAIDYIKDTVENPYLFVFSDDIEWVKKEKRFDIEHLYISNNGFSDCEELILMSMCSNNIIANSTFSYWGAWLNSNKGKIVITPRGWRQKIIPDTWVKL